MFKKVLLLISTIFLTSCDSGSYKGPPSDHFNGKVFFNPTNFKEHRFTEVLKWWSTRKHKPWPENLPAPIPTPVVNVTDPKTVRVTFINHATVLIQTKDFNLLTDPNWSNKVGPFSWLGVKRKRQPGLPFENLPSIQAVLISHSHYDHMDIPTLKRLMRRFHPLFIVPLGNKVFLEQKGITPVVELDWWQHYSFTNATITFLPAHHWSARWLNDRNKTLWGSFGISLAGRKLYFAGDTGYSTHFSEIAQKWGAPDLSFLPIGAYKPHWFMKDSHVSPEEAVQAMLDLKSKQAIAIHYGTFQLGDDGYDEPLQDLKIARQKHGIAKSQFFNLPEGQGWDLGSTPP